MPSRSCITASANRPSRRKILAGLPRLRALPRPTANRPRRRAVKARLLPENFRALAELEAAFDSLSGNEME